MTTLSDMPMITIEQKNRFREAALEVEKERDELAAQFSEMASLADSLTFASSEDEAEEIVQKIAGLVHDEGGALARRDASMKTEALEPLCEKFQRDADEAEEDGDVTAQLHWLRTVMHVEILQKEYRKQAEGGE